MALSVVAAPVAGADVGHRCHDVAAAEGGATPQVIAEPQRRSLGLGWRVPAQRHLVAGDVCL